MTIYGPNGRVISSQPRGAGKATMQAMLDELRQQVGTKLLNMVLQKIHKELKPYKGKFGEAGMQQLTDLFLMDLHQRIQDILSPEETKDDAK